jgi:hypothetical protein
MKALAVRARNWTARRAPELYWRHYSGRARAMGLDKLYLILSFDCDTREDVEASALLDGWLRPLGVAPVYAVPGAQLRAGADVYRGLAATGAEFMNHGALPHTEWGNGRYNSVTFYDRMSDGEVVDDIKRGHAIVEEVIGAAPIGFRAPHFGCFQSRRQLGLQYSVLRSLGYAYSTSTLPASALRHGPVWNPGGIPEIPLTGSWRQPFSILDSWSHALSAASMPIRS